jgi:hypothetical protein
MSQAFQVNANGNLSGMKTPIVEVTMCTGRKIDSLNDAWIECSQKHNCINHIQYIFGAYGFGENENIGLTAYRAVSRQDYCTLKQEFTQQKSH